MQQHAIIGPPLEQIDAAGPLVNQNGAALSTPLSTMLPCQWYAKEANAATVSSLKQKMLYLAGQRSKDTTTGSELFPSRIPDSGSASKNLSILTQKMFSKL